MYWDGSNYIGVLKEEEKKKKEKYNQYKLKKAMATPFGLIMEIACDFCKLQQSDTGKSIKFLSLF